MSSPSETTKKIVKKTKAAAPEVAVAAPAVAAPAPVKKATKAVAAKTEVTVPVVPVAAPAPVVEAAPAVEASAAPTTLEIVERIRDLRTRLSAELKTIIADTLSAAKSSAREVKDARRRKRVKKDVADMTAEEKAAHELRRSKNAFLKPRDLSAELCAFMGLPTGSQRSQTDVTKFVSSYVKSHGCFDPANKRRIVPDGALARLLKATDAEKPITYLNLQSYLKVHFPKPATTA
jgi:chromatin remodeling complex protein RSC6